MAISEKDFQKEIHDDLIKEAVSHFLKITGHPGNVDSRFFYNKKELNEFWNLYHKNGGIDEKLCQRTIIDECGDVFCYEIYADPEYIYNPDIPHNVPYFKTLQIKAQKKLDNAFPLSMIKPPKA